MRSGNGEAAPPTVRFYQAVPGVDRFRLIATLAAKAIERGLRAVVVVADLEQARLLDAFLWRFPDDGFLPHGLADEPDPERQPLLIATAPGDSNAATVLIAAADRPIADPGRFDLIIDFAVTSADPDQAGNLASRQRYGHYRQLGCRMEYWVQKPAGGWEKRS
ncbi:MAG: DNA polymerase III subunit chi [Magnetococcales bacterium]|nr:DNA polymerase III subunit chi [Magnetococcales bacterium]